MDCKVRAALITLSAFLLSSCTFNPFTTNNQLTGTATGTAVGAGIGVGSAALITQSAKPGPLIAGGLIGAAVGYYVSSLRFASGGVIQGGGQVFTLGDYVSINIPTDRIFDSNSDELLDDSGPVLDSAVAVLKRYPDNNIMVTGSTSGFGLTKFELKLSEDRARQVAAYLWAHGIGEFKSYSLSRRKLSYTGYGDFFPIANNIRNDSIRQNSRIQITAYPSKAQLGLTKRQRVFSNIGDSSASKSDVSEEDMARLNSEFSEVMREDGVATTRDVCDPSM